MEFKYYNKIILYTTPIINIDFVKIIDTLEGTSLEGQYLSGKKLIIISLL